MFAALYEERALLLGRLKKHQQALAIYTQILKNYKAAEKYCMNCYEPKDPEHSKVRFENCFQKYLKDRKDVHHSDVFLSDCSEIFC